MSYVTIVDIARAYENDTRDTGILARAFRRAHEALKEINRYNHLSNDLEAYLFDLAKYGMGEDVEKPLPQSFGLQE